jgi:hypothetical protein
MMLDWLVRYSGRHPRGLSWIPHGGEFVAPEVKKIPSPVVRFPKHRLIRHRPTYRVMDTYVRAGHEV